MVKISASYLQPFCMNHPCDRGTDDSIHSAVIYAVAR